MPNFKPVLERKRERLAERPDKAEVEVHVESQQVSGLKSRVKARGFELTIDMPSGFAGGDEGPRPGEFVLAALAACHEITYRLYADYLDIPLDKIAVSVTGVSDARGFLGPEHGISPGFKAIRGTIAIESPADDRDIERLRQAVNAHCPVLDDLRRAVSVELDVKREVRVPPTS